MNIIQIYENHGILAAPTLSVNHEEAWIKVTPAFYWAVPELASFGVFMGSGPGGLYWRVPRWRLLNI